MVFAERGKNFLEYRREQLIYQIKKVYSEFLQKQEEFFFIFKEVLIKLNQSYMEMGKLYFNMIKNLYKIRFNPQINIVYKKVVGIITPKINYELLKKKQLPAYGFENTSHYLDELIIILKEFFEKLIILAELEDLIIKLSINFQKLNRRINSLNHQIIPNLKFEIKKVKDMIEEVEREEYVRLKSTKNIIYKKKAIKL